MANDVVQLSKAAAYRQREALRLLSEENAELRKQAGGQARLSREAADRAAAALARTGHIQEAQRAKTAAAISANPEAAVELLEAVAEDRQAPSALGGPDGSVKKASSQSAVKESDAIWDNHFGS